MLNLNMNMFHSRFHVWKFLFVEKNLNFDYKNQMLPFQMQSFKIGDLSVRIAARYWSLKCLKLWVKKDCGPGNRKLSEATKSKVQVNQTEKI